MTAIAIANTIMLPPPLLPPSRKMMMTAPPHNTLLSVSTSIGTKLRTRNWKTMLSTLTPLKGIEMIRINPATNICCVLCSSQMAPPATSTTGPIITSRSASIEPSHSISSSGAREASRMTTPSMPKFRR